MEIIYGINPSFEIIKAGKRKIYSILFSQNNGRIEKILDLAHSQNIKTRKATKDELTKLANTDKHQGIVLQVSPYKYYTIDDLIDKRNKFVNILILDGITDPHNLGAIIRSAEVLNFDGIVIRKERAGKINSTVVKTSAGATEYMKIAIETNLSRAVEKFQQNNFWVFAATEKTDKRIYDMDFRYNSVIIIGDEGKGISKNLLQKSDFQFKIPVLGNISSLNASVSSAISMYEVIRQQKSGDNAPPTLT